MFNVAYTWSHGLTSYVADRSTGSIMPVHGHIRNNNWDRALETVVMFLRPTSFGMCRGMRRNKA